MLIQDVNIPDKSVYQILKYYRLSRVLRGNESERAAFIYRQLTEATARLNGVEDVGVFALELQDELQKMLFSGVAA